MNSTYSYTIEKTPFTVITLMYDPPTGVGLPITVKIAPEKGSNMFSYMYGPHELIYSDPEILNVAGYTGTYVLFPTPNRVKDFTYSWNGVSHTLKKNGKPVSTHHQLVYDQPFIFTHPVVAKESVSCSTSITINTDSHLFDGFPFPCTLTLTYTLNARGVTVEYSVKNIGNTDLPFGFGLHPHFTRLSGNDNTYITIPAKSWMESPEETLLPTGNLIDVSGKPYNVNTPQPIAELSLDHVYTDIPKDSYACIDYRNLGFNVSLIASEDFTHTVVYTGNELAVCMENQTCSTDAHNLFAKGFVKESHLITVAPGLIHSGSISYDIVPH